MRLVSKATRLRKGAVPATQLPATQCQVHFRARCVNTNTRYNRGAECIVVCRTRRQVKVYPKVLEVAADRGGRISTTGNNTAATTAPRPHPISL